MAILGAPNQSILLVPDFEFKTDIYLPLEMTYQNIWENWKQEKMFIKEELNSIIFEKEIDQGFSRSSNFVILSWIYIYIYI